MNGKNNLEIALQIASWDAVDEARRLGEHALPVVKKYSEDEDYQKRQVAVACAGVIKDDGSVPILTAGLEDSNINVRISAAKAINENPNPGETDTVLEKLENSKEEVLREFFALTAGKLPGENTMVILKKIQDAEEGQVSKNAQMALAKLNDSEAKQAIVNEITDELPRTRYDALEKLIYIDEVGLASHAKILLGDKSEALMFGNIKQPRYRRVCDQAVDTIVFLLDLSPTFRVSKGVIYSNDDIEEVKKISRGS